MNFLYISKNRSGLLNLDRNLSYLLKFIACIMVMMSHYSGYALVSGLSSSIIYKGIAALCGYLGVAFFFFFSGYGLMKSDMKHHLSCFDFFKRRLAKTYLPAVLVSAIWLFVAILVNLDLLCNQHYLLGVIWQFNDEVLWFVRVIVLLYFCFFLYRLKFQDKSHRWLYLLLLTLLAYVFVRITGIGSSLSVPIFFMGVFVADYSELIKKRNVLSYKGGVILAFLFLILLWFCKNDNYLLHGWINYLCIITFIFLIANFEIKIANVPQWIRDWSYNIYLVHWKVHLMILLCFQVNELWMFFITVGIVTYLFSFVRKLLRI